MNELREASHRPSVSNLDAKRPHGTAGMDRLKQRRPALLDPGLQPMSSGDAKRAAVLAPMGRESATGAFGVPWRDYFDLCKPRVVSLVVFTALVSMCLALPAGPIDWRTLLAGTLGIALAAASAAAFNHVADRDIDAMMRRTRRRPLPTHALEVHQALIFALALGTIAILFLWVTVNPLTAVLALVTLIGYAVVYTRWLKWLTPQNIVLGGASGAAPAILGWTAVTGEVQAPAIALFLIVFVWTPAHFWPLAIARRDEYAVAGGTDAAGHARGGLHAPAHTRLFHRARPG
jgi:heme O synthase-like polyprenyltransferase